MTNETAPKAPAVGLRLPLLLSVLPVAVSGCLPAGATDQGRAIRSLYDVVFVVAVIIFVLVEGMIIWSVIRYRRKPGDDELPPQIHGNNAAEIAWTAIPLVIVLVIFFLSWQTLNTVQATGTPGVTIEVTAFQWQWQFRYPGTNVTVLGTFEKPAEMVVPVDAPIQIKLRSADVIHAFYVPAFNFKRDAIPGQENDFEFTARPVGVYHGQCAEFCGLYHSKMLLTVRVVSRPDFDSWLKAAATTSPPAASVAPSGKPGASGSAESSAGPAAAVVRIASKNIAFDQSQLTAPADTPFQIVFDNEDNGIPHNVAIYTDPSAATAVFSGDVFAGLGTRVQWRRLRRPGHADLQRPGAQGRQLFLPL